MESYLSPLGWMMPCQGSEMGAGTSTSRPRKVFMRYRRHPLQLALPFSPRYSWHLMAASFGPVV